MPIAERLLRIEKVYYILECIPQIGTITYCLARCRNLRGVYPFTKKRGRDFCGGPPFPGCFLIRGNGIAFGVVRGILQCRRWIIHDDGRGGPAIRKVRHFRHFQVGDDGGFAEARQVERCEPHGVPPLVDDGLCIPLQWQGQTVQRVLLLYLLMARRPRCRRRFDDGLNLGRVAPVRRSRAR
jgi:hypothetical protein